MDRTAQNPGFFLSGGQGFLSSFSGSFDESLSRRLVSGYQEPRTAQCSARVSRSLQPRGRWARSGKNISGSQQFAGVVGVAQRAGAGFSGASRFDEREQFAYEAVLPGSHDRHLEEQRAPGGRQQFSGSQQSAGAGGVAPRAGAVSAGAIDLADREHFAGCAGLHGEEQRAPGGWRALRSLPGALRQVRKFHAEPRPEILSGGGNRARVCCFGGLSFMS